MFGLALLEARVQRGGSCQHRQRVGGPMAWAEEPEPEYKASVESLTEWLAEEAIAYFNKRNDELANTND